MDRLDLSIPLSPERLSQLKATPVSYSVVELPVRGALNVFLSSHENQFAHCSCQVVLNFSLLMIIWTVVLPTSPYIGHMYHLAAVAAVSDVLNTNPPIGKQT